MGEEGREPEPEQGEGSDWKEALGALVFFLPASRRAQDLVSSVDSCVQLRHLILQHQEGNPAEDTPPSSAFPSPPRYMLGNPGLEERQGITPKESRSPCC